MALHVAVAIELVMHTAMRYVFLGTILHLQNHFLRSVFHFESPRTEYQLFHRRLKKAHRFAVEHKVLQPRLLHEVSMMTTEVID